MRSTTQIGTKLTGYLDTSFTPRIQNDLTQRYRKKKSKMVMREDRFLDVITDNPGLQVINGRIGLGATPDARAVTKHRRPSELRHTYVAIFWNTAGGLKRNKKKNIKRVR